MMICIVDIILLCISSLLIKEVIILPPENSIFNIGPITTKPSLPSSSNYPAWSQGSGLVSSTPYFDYMRENGLSTSSSPLNSPTSMNSQGHTAFLDPGGGDPAAFYSADKPQPNSSTSDAPFPGAGMNLQDTIFGLPPADVSNKDTMMHSIFINSFPILKMRQIKLSRPENSQTVKSTEPIGEEYKFAIKTDGGASFSISNEYGSSMIEDAFVNMIQLDSIGQLHQLLKTSRVLNRGLEGAGQYLKNNFNNAFQRGESELNEINAIASKYIEQSTSNKTNGLISAMTNIGKTALSGMFGGQKIDIPNIWKGSSSTLSQQVTIVLHTWKVPYDKEFEEKIILPLQILLRFALPYSTASAGDDQSNDIITYENPPYIEASVDGIFRTKLGAISDMSVSTNFSDQSLHSGGRPMIVTVSFTIIDLYSTIIWSEKEHPYAPNGLGITNFLKDHKRDPAVQEIHSDVQYQFMPDGTSDTGNDAYKWQSAMNQNNTWQKDVMDSITNTTDFGSGISGVDPSNNINFSQDIGINTSNINIPSDVSSAWQNSNFINIGINNNMFTDLPTAQAMTMLSDAQINTIALQELTYINPQSLIFQG